MMRNLVGILRMLKPHYWKVILSALFALVVSAVPGSTVLLIKPVIDRALLQKDLRLLKFISIGVLFLYFLKGLMRFLHSYIMVYVSQNVGRELRNRIYSQFLRLDISEIERRTSGELNAIILNDVSRIEIAIPSVILLIREPFTLAGLIFSAFVMNWRLSLFAVFVIPLGILPLVRITRLLKNYGRRIQQEIGRISSLINETFGGIKIIKAFTAERFMEEKFFRINEDIVRKLLKYTRLQEGTSPFMELLGAIGVSLVIFYGGYQVIKGESTPGSFLAFITACGLMYEPFKRLNASLTILQHSFASYERIEEVLQWKEEEKGGTLEFKGLEDGITFEEVRFSYGNEEILKGVSFEVKRGEKVAIVGQSGAGKTTLVSLLLRLYRETGGRILLDGRNIREFSVESLRRHIAFVPQEPFLFEGSIRENVRMGDREASEKKVEDSVTKAGLESFLPHLNTLYVGERGETLSGGEKQRVAIARAMLKEASIVILDEATSSLDSETEKKIEEALNALTREKTVFIIAHRLSTVRNADKIVVIKDGMVVEEGKHEELLKRRGEYYRIYREQIGDEAS